MVKFFWSGRKNPDLGVQISKMKSLFPSFNYHRENNQIFWIGTLQPTEISPTYKIKIIYRYKKSPKAFVIEPSILNNPHLYPNDQSICIHYPKDSSWTYSSIIAETIVPWIAEWLLCYEFWLDTGIWPGEEAPHKGKKELD